MTSTSPSQLEARKARNQALYSTISPEIPTQEECYRLLRPFNISSSSPSTYRVARSRSTRASRRQAPYPTSIARSRGAPTIRTEDTRHTSAVTLDVAEIEDSSSRTNLGSLTQLPRMADSTTGNDEDFIDPQLPALIDTRSSGDHDRTTSSAPVSGTYNSSFERVGLTIPIDPILASTTISRNATTTPGRLRNPTTKRRESVLFMPPPSLPNRVEVLRVIGPNGEMLCPARHEPSSAISLFPMRVLTGVGYSVSAPSCSPEEFIPIPDGLNPVARCSTGSYVARRYVRDLRICRESNPVAGPLTTNAYAFPLPEPTPRSDGEFEGVDDTELSIAFDHDYIIMGRNLIDELEGYEPIYDTGEPDFAQH